MLLRHTAHYLIAGLASAIFGLLSAVVFTRMLTPSDYGIYIIGVSIAGVVSAVLFTWLRYSAMRFQSEGDAVDVRATALVAYAISACAAPVAIALVSLVWRLPVERAALAVLFALGLGIFELGQELLKARMRTLSYVVASVFRSVCAFTLCLTAAHWGGGGLGQLGMAALAYFVTAGFIANQVWKGPMAPVDLSRLKTFVRLGAPITLAGFIFAFHASLDRLFVTGLMGESAAGLYGASADLVRQIVLIPAGSVAAATIPLAVRALANASQDAVRVELENGAELLLAVLLPCVLGLALTSPYLAELVLGPAFRPTAISIMPILAFAWLFQSISQSYVHTSFHLAKRPELTVAHALATLVINAATIGPMISYFGLPGAAASLVLAEGVGVLFGFVLTRRAHALPLIPMRAAKIAVAGAFMALVLHRLEGGLTGQGPIVFATLAVSGAASYALACLALDVAGSRGYLERVVSARLSTGLARSL